MRRIKGNNVILTPDEAKAFAEVLRLGRRVAEKHGAHRITNVDTEVVEAQLLQHIDFCAEQGITPESLAK